MNFAEANEKLAALRESLDEGVLTETSRVLSSTRFVRGSRCELQKAMKSMLRSIMVQAMSKSKWPTSAMEHGVTRYRPNKMTPDDFMDELSTTLRRG